MALVINASDVAVSTPVAASGVTEVVASGDFAGATVSIQVSASAGAYAPVHTFFSPGAVSLQTAAGTLIRASVTGGNTPSIDVAVNP
jgi:hypothetical protein